MQPSGKNSGTYSSLNSLIQLRLDAKLLKLDLSRGARSILSGQHISNFRGRGMDYAESRHYQPGDDVRSIDWRLNARTGKTYTKLFIEERERPIFMLVDFSPSLYFGTKTCFKSVNAARAAALLGWAAVQNGDRLGAVVVYQGKPIDLKPKSGRSGALSLANLLSKATENRPNFSDKNTFNDALRHLNTVIHPGSLVFLFSDFYNIDKTSERLISKIRRHNDVIACQLIDPLELSPPGNGRYAITNEPGANSVVTLDTTNKNSRDKYENLYLQRKQRINDIFSDTRIPIIELINGENTIETVQSLFSKSASKRGNAGS